MIVIDEQIQAFARELAQLAQKYDIRRINGSILPGLDHKWRNEIHFVWTAGRHGEDGYVVNLSTSQDVQVRLTSPDPTNENSNG